MTKKDDYDKNHDYEKKELKKKTYDNSKMTTVKVGVAVNWIVGAKVSEQRASATFLSVKAKAQP